MPEPRTEARAEQPNKDDEPERVSPVVTKSKVNPKFGGQVILMCNRS